MTSHHPHFKIHPTVQPTHTTLGNRITGPFYLSPVTAVLFATLLWPAAFAAQPKTPDAAVEAKVLYQAPLAGTPLHILGQVRIKDEDLSLIVDTGCEPTLMLDIVAASTFGPPLRETTINQTAKGADYLIPAAQLGSITIPSHECPASDLTVARASTGLPIAGAVGWGALKGRTLILDHDKRQLRIVGGAVNWPGSIASPVEVIDGVPHVRAQMGTQELPVAIDTGSDSTVSLADGEFDRLVGEGWIRQNPEGGKAATVAGVHAVKSGRFVQGSLFGVDLKGLSVDGSPSGHNLVGLLFLLKLNVALSNEPSRFSHALRKDPEPPISPNRITGAIFLYRGGHAVVAKIKEGGAAEKAGLMFRDEITGIDENGHDPLNSVNFYNLCKTQAGKSLTLHLLRNGSPKKVVLNLLAASSAWEENPDAIIGKESPAPESP